VWQHVWQHVASVKALLDVWEWMINPTFVFQSFKGRCHGSKQLWGQIDEIVVALAFQNGLEDRNADGHVNSSNESSILLQFDGLRSSIASYRVYGAQLCMLQASINSSAFWLV